VKDDIKSNLDAIFKKADDTKKEVQRVKEEREAKEAQFLAAFQSCCANIVRPAMEEIGKYAESQGHPYQIAARDEKKLDSGLTEAATISILFPPEKNKYYRFSDVPSFTVQCEKGRQQIGFLESTMRNGSGMTGPAGEGLALADVTQQLVQAKIVQVLQKTFGK
jgi:hypothetical protein